MPEPAPLPASARWPRHPSVAQSAGVTLKKEAVVNPSQRCRAVLHPDGCPCARPGMLPEPPRYPAVPTLTQPEKKKKRRKKVISKLTMRHCCASSLARGKRHRAGMGQIGKCCVFTLSARQEQSLKQASCGPIWGQPRQQGAIPIAALRWCQIRPHHPACNPVRLGRAGGSLWGALGDPQQSPQRAVRSKVRGCKFPPRRIPPAGEHHPGYLIRPSVPGQAVPCRYHRRVYLPDH